MDKDFAAPIDAVIENEKTSKKAIRNRVETIKLIKKHGGLYGRVLDIGEHNLFTDVLQGYFEKATIENTWGDLDMGLNCLFPIYNYVHYNNVIEHQFNPLRTLLDIKEVLSLSGTLILGTPIKPSWITSAKCHFHEMDEYRFKKLIARAGFEIFDEVHFWHDISLNGIRGILGSFYTKQAVYLLKHKI
ncbi:MAG TPA: hypothetical protein VK172_14830 [Lentimicrobium sp.]|nr:hypothetical protein [Bacteroidales bacterium]HLO92437.1 hypothetical protein [Lentimicrobium sp.]